MHLMKINRSNVRFVAGDLFNQSADIRVNTVNCVGVMGKGVALMFKIQYPLMFHDYKMACQQGLVIPGKLHIWTAPDNTVVINFPTKRHWRNSSLYADIKIGLVALKAYLEDAGKVTVALPALGCGHGGLDWCRVSKLIRKYLSGLDAIIYVFEPASSHT